MFEQLLVYDRNSFYIKYTFIYERTQAIADDSYELLCSVIMHINKSRLIIAFK